MEGNTKKVIVILLSTIGAVAIIGSLTQVLLISPLHSTMAQQQQQNVIQPSSIDPLPSSPSSSSSLANVFKRVENSVVQITSTRSNPNQITIINGVPANGICTELGAGCVSDNLG